LDFVMAKPPKNGDQIEIVPDGWERFERAVDSVAKGGPQHRAAKPVKAGQARSALPTKDSRRGKKT
jgi:hypothetical protein